MVAFGPRTDAPANLDAADRKAIPGNLRQPASAADQYFIETGLSTVPVSELVGPDRRIRHFKPVAGELYPRAIRQSDEELSAQLQSGESLRILFWQSRGVGCSSANAIPRGRPVEASARGWGFFWLGHLSQAGTKEVPGKNYFTCRETQKGRNLQGPGKKYFLNATTPCNRHGRMGASRCRLGRDGCPQPSADRPTSPASLIVSNRRHVPECVADAWTPCVQ